MVLRSWVTLFISFLWESKSVTRSIWSSYPKKQFHAAHLTNVQLLTISIPYTRSSKEKKVQCPQSRPGIPPPAQTNIIGGRLLFFFF